MKRIQYRRGMKLPEGARYVGRPSRWGNPYKVKLHGRERALQLYRERVERLSPEARRIWLEPLRGATALACYCKPDETCHADILIEYLEKES